MDPTQEVRAIARKPRDDLLAIAIGLSLWALLIGLVAVRPLPAQAPDDLDAWLRLRGQRSDTFVEAQRTDLRKQGVALWGVRIVALPAFGLCLWAVGQWVAARPREIVLTPFSVRIGGRAEPWERVDRVSWSADGCRVLLRDGDTFGLDGSWALGPGDAQRLEGASGIALARVTAADPLDRSALDAVSRLTGRDEPG